MIPPASDTTMARGPGLFAIERSDGAQARTLITNIRRLAGRERPPGSMLITAATWLLGILDAGLLYVSFDAQYQYIFAVKHAKVPAMIEAAMLDAGMIILSALGIGLAMRGKASKAERFLIMVCSAASAGMNFAAANTGSWRSVVAYTAAPVFLAIITDRVISVIRRHVLPGITKVTADRAITVPAIAGPAEPEAQDDRAGQDDTRDDEPAIEFATKKQAFLSRYRGHPQYGLREAAGRVAAELAPLAGLQAGTGRTYIAEELRRIDAAVADYLARGNLAFAAPEGEP